MTLTFEDGKPIDQRSSNIEVGYWQGKLPATGAYFITVQPVAGTTEANFDLEVRLAPLPEPTPSPTQEATPTPSATTDTEFQTSTPTGDRQIVSRRVDVDPNGAGTILEENIAPNQLFRYNVPVLGGQTLTVKPLEGDVRVEVYDPNGDFVWTAPGSTQQQVGAVVPGMYQVRITTDKPAYFRVAVTLE